MPLPGHYAVFTVRARTGPEEAPKHETKRIAVFVEGAIGGGSGPVLETELAELRCALHIVRAADVSALVDDLVHIDVGEEK